VWSLIFLTSTNTDQKLVFQNFHIEYYRFISPTHKRAEGRALAWGSEFTSKGATLQGDPAETAAGLNVKLWDSVTAL
jgi:acyl-coenzyme A thioesterase PaaI-like protein